MKTIDPGAIEKILQLTRANLKYCRAEMEAGFDCSTVYYQLQRHEHFFQQKMSEIRAHNLRADAEAKAKAETTK